MLLCFALLANCLALPSLALAEDEWITLRVETFDRSIAGFNVEDCMQLRYVQENFGDPNHIKVEFVATSRWDEGEILTTQLAGGTACDLCVTYQGTLVNQYIDMGGLYQLDDLIDAYGSNIKAFLGENLLDYGTIDTDGDGVKEQYYIPARRISVANVGIFIRNDWLKALDMEIPTNLDELEAYLYAAKEANLGGQITIPLSYGIYESDPLYGTKRLVDCFVDFSQMSEEYWVAYSANHEMMPGARDAFRLMNKWYHDGILYENFAVDTDGSLMDTYMTQGNVGFFFGEQPDQPWRTDKNYQTEMAKNVEGAEWIPVNCFQNIYTGDYLHDIYDASGLSIFIPGWVDEKVATAAIKYLDWMCQEENMFFLQNGTEGVNYLSVNEDGIPVELQTTEIVPDEYKMHAGDICFIANGLYYGSDEKNAAAISLSFPGFEEQVKQSYVYAMTDAWTQISFPESVEAATDYLATVKSKQCELIAQAITCDPESFDEVYDSYIEAIKTSGATEIIEGYREAYQNGNWRGSYPYADN